MSELLWLDEEELRDAYADLLTKLVRTEQMMVMMAVEMEKAVAYGYRVGYEDGVAGESYSVQTGHLESLVLH